MFSLCFRRERQEFNEEPSWSLWSLLCEMPVKCQVLFQDFVCCLWTGSLSCELDYRNLEDGSFYVSAPLQLAFKQPAGITATLLITHTFPWETNTQTTVARALTHTLRFKRQIAADRQRRWKNNFASCCEYVVFVMSGMQIINHQFHQSHQRGPPEQRHLIE